MLAAEIGIRFGTRIRGQLTVDQLAVRVEYAILLQVADGGVAVRCEDLVHFLMKAVEFLGNATARRAQITKAGETGQIDPGQMDSHR